MEAGFLYANGNVVFWHLPLGATAVFLPDSPNLWEALWKYRFAEDLAFVHSHPPGATWFSSTDLDTIKAIEAGLGRSLDWYVLCGHVTGDLELIPLLQTEPFSKPLSLDSPCIWDLAFYSQFSQGSPGDRHEALCKNCFEVCPTFMFTSSEDLWPRDKLAIKDAERIIGKEHVWPRMDHLGCPVCGSTRMPIFPNVLVEAVYARIENKGQLLSKLFCTTKWERGIVHVPDSDLVEHFANIAIDTMTATSEAVRYRLRDVTELCRRYE